MANELSFFELGVGDSEKGRAFYESLFGWEFETGPSGDGWVIGAAGVPGGMHPGDEGANPYVFFRVEDLEEAMAKVRELGGKTKDLPDSDESITEFGRFALCEDDQGSHFGLHEPPAR
jgi:predicted enzyme related to lactoylglutathione lyase